ncbi:MAG: carboxypeptidase-like regulatory domain-containing protein, partial [Cetobacterium sp.]
DTVNSKFSLKGKGGGDIEALIPIKPLYSITGTLSVEDKIGDSMSFYEGVVVKVLNSKGEDIMTTLLDFTGQFDVSGLNSGKYTLEISSFKDDGIKPLIKELSINYNEVGSNLLVVNTILKNNTIMIKE